MHDFPLFTTIAICFFQKHQENSWVLNKRRLSLSKPERSGFDKLSLRSITSINLKNYRLC